MLFRFSLASIALMGIFSANAFAQGNQTAAPTVAPKMGATSVALVDVAYIIKNHPTMNAAMEQIKAEMTAAQEEIETRRKKLLEEGELVQKTYDATSSAFKDKQEQLLNQESKLRVDFMAKEKEFAEKQAKVVAESYRDITQAINTVATAYKYDLVLRFSREQNEMDPKKPQSVNFGIQKDVLYQADKMDVTDYVLYVLQSNKPGAPAATNNNTAPRVGTAPAGPNSPRIRN